MCVCVCPPRTQATSTPRNGRSQHGLLPTPGVTQAFVFLLPASCLLKTFHWPPANDTKLVQKGRKGETALGPHGDLLLLQGKDLWATARERVRGLCGLTPFSSPAGHFANSAYLLPGLAGLTSYSPPLACEASLKICAMENMCAALGMEGKWGQHGMDTVKFTVF